MITQESQTEWDNVLTPTGANLNDGTDPKVGTVAMSFPVYTGSDVLSFKKDSLVTFVPDESLIFYIKPIVRFPLKSSLTFKLINSATLGYWNINLSTANLTNYGFDLDAFGDWQLIQIPLSEFVVNSRAETQYDTLELTFSKTSALDLDWFVIQGDVANPSTGALEGYNESGTQAAEDLVVKIGQKQGVFIQTDEIHKTAVLNMTAEEIDAHADKRTISNKDYIEKVTADGYLETGTQLDDDLDVTLGYEIKNRVNIDENGNLNVFKDGTGSIVSNMTPDEIEAAADGTLVTKGYLREKKVKITLTSADLLASSDSSKTLLVDAQGIGTAIRPIRADFQYRYGTTSYVGNNEPFSIGTDNEDLLKSRTAVANITSSQGFLCGTGVEGFWYDVWEEGEAIYVYFDTTAGNELTAGDGELDVWFTYEILDL